MVRKTRPFGSLLENGKLVIPEGLSCMLLAAFSLLGLEVCARETPGGMAWSITGESEAVKDEHFARVNASFVSASQRER